MTNEFNGNVPPKPPERPEKKQRFQGEQKQSHAQVRWVQIRLIPIWLRMILITVLFVITAAIGVTVGYGYIGNGDPGDALKWSSWQHIFDIIGGLE